jgi:hypothetical protein
MDSEGEILEAHKPGTGTSTSVRVKDKPGGRIPLGVEDKLRVDVIVGSRSGTREKRITMVRREVKLARDANDFCGYWRRLQDAGIPTFPTVRKINDNEVLVTDATADGSAFFGKASVYPGYNRYRDDGITKVDRLFLQIKPEDVENRARLIAQKATRNGIALPYDDPFDLLVHPDGTWELLVIDLVPSNPKGRGISYQNRACVEKFMRFYEMNRDCLSVGKKPPNIVG